MFEERKKDIEKAFSEIADYIDDYESKENILKANTNDVKNAKAGVISAISFIPSMGAGISIIAPISAGLALPMTSAMGIALALSVAIGYAGQAIITFSAKNKMKKFIGAKTNAEILEEMMHYGIEIKKLESKQEILRKMYRSIETKEQILSDWSDEIYQIDKYDSFMLEDLKRRKEKLTEAYNEKMENLDVIITQEYLNKKSKSFRKKGNRIENIAMGAFGVSLFCSFFIGIPLSVELNKTMIESFSDLIKLFTMIFSPTLVAVPLSIPYFNKRNKDFMNAFNNLNQTLGENVLSENPNIDYVGLSDNISRRIDELVELGMELTEIGYAIEKRSSETTTDNKENEKTNSILDNLGRKSVENIINDTTPFPDGVYRPNYYAYTTDKEEKQDKGPKLVKKRIPPKK